ncbi:hypothetical protein PG996_006668 [Apiospora saccharicola]|uniref:Uncharacterized protein n=1 Tax=Apiospora saccharicola TaxID=335842 RepID=A0ABR1V8M6_9PEZI
MIKRFESLDRANLRHLWGVPFFDPRDDKSPDEIVDYAGFFLAGLCWRHVAATEKVSTRAKTKQLLPPVSSPRRRKKFPSWSWTSWEGAVTWPRVEKTYEVRARDPDTGLASIRLSFEDNTTRSIPDVRRSPRPGEGGPPRWITLRLGTIGELGFLLVVKKKGRSYYRVGLMRVRSAVITEGMETQDVRVFKLK